MKQLSIGRARFFVRNAVDEGVCREVAEKRCYEKPRLGFFVQSGERWIDCGANIGAFAVWAELERNATVFGYEACKENAEVACANLLANKCRSQVEVAFVTTRNDGVTSMNYKPDTPSRSSYRSDGVQRFVRNRSLASIIQQHRPHGIKIDIEGGEFPILDEGFPLEGVRAVAVEYHFRFDKSYREVRRRIAFLRSHFKKHAYRKDIDTAEAFGGWQDETMFFWS